MKKKGTMMVEMSNYTLRRDESIIMRHENPSRIADEKSQHGMELILTNKNIIYSWETRKLFSKSIPHQDVYPLSRIKIINGHIQAKYSERSNQPQLDLFFTDSSVSFAFSLIDEKACKKEIAKWLDSISQELTGQPSQEAAAVRKTIPSVEMVANIIKGTFDTFKHTFVAEESSPAASQITGRCIGCRAPISGAAGQRVRCTYCDTDQTLQRERM